MYFNHFKKLIVCLCILGGIVTQFPLVAQVVNFDAPRNYDPSLDARLIPTRAVNPFEGDQYCREYGSVLRLDLNGDGILDRVKHAHLNRAIELEVFLGTGQNNEEVQVGSYPTNNFELENIYVATVKTGDFNGDQIPDVLVWLFGSAYYGGFIESGIQVFLGNGDGTLQTLPRPTNESGWNVSSDHEPIIADFNQDGADEFVTLRNGIFRVYTYQATSQRMTFLSRGSGLEDYIDQTLSVQDFNQDQVPDIALIQNANHRELVFDPVFINPGDGIFEIGTTYNFDGQRNVQAAIGDWNKDGLDDVATVGADTPNTLTIYLNQGQKQFQRLQDYPFENEIGRLLVGDINGDNLLDIAFNQTGEFRDDMSILLGEGNGQFTGLIHSLKGQIVGLENVDQDASLELLVQHVNKLEVYDLDNLNQLSLNQQLESRAMHVKSGDFNGDQILDILLVTRLGGSFDNDVDVSIRYGNEQGGFGKEQLILARYYALDKTIYDIFIDDFNQDGFSDLGFNEAYINDQQGGFSPFVFPKFEEQDNGYTKLLYGDIDGDGLKDFIRHVGLYNDYSYSSESRFLGVNLNQGGGNYGETTIFRTYYPDFLGYFDEDNLIDIFAYRIFGDDSEPSPALFTFNILTNTTTSENPYINTTVNNCRGDVQLTSQEEVNAFTCTEVLGDLVIQGEDIQDLSILNNLTRIVGELKIIGNTQLKTLVNFTNLVEVGGIAIQGNPLLNRIQGFDQLTEIQTTICVSDNAELKELAGFSNLQIIKRNLSFISNAKLHTVSAFANLTRLEGSITLNNLDELTNLNGLRNLTYMDGTFYMTQANKLSNLKGLQSLEEVATGFVLNNNSLLQTLDGLENLRKIGSKIPASLIIYNNPNLLSLDALIQLESIGRDLSITYNKKLSTCCALTFSAIFSMPGYIEIKNNAQGCNSVSDLDACSTEACINGSYYLTLSTQAEVDAFNCTNLYGGLIIQGNDIQNLDNLKSLKKLAGDLRIQYTSLTSLQGLENMELAEGHSVDIRNNPSLQNLKGLEGLKSLDYLTIRNNGQLQTLKGLENVEVVSDRFTIATHANLQSIAVLSNVKVLGDLYIENNSQLVNLQGLEGIKQGAEFKFTENVNLKNFKGLDNLEALESLTLAQTFFESFEGLENLSRINGRAAIRESYLLPNFQGLSNLQFIQSLSVANNPRLVDFEGIQADKVFQFHIVENNNLSSLKGLEQIKEIEDLTIELNPQLSNLAHLPKVNILFIYNNASLVNLSGLESFKHFEQLSIRENNSLVDLQGLENLETLSSLTLFRNPALTELSALSNLKNLSSLYIRECNALKDLKGLEGLESIPYIEIRENATLESLDGLDKLKEVFGEGLFIMDNPTLTNVEALQNLEKASEIKITGNSSLSECCILNPLLASVFSFRRTIENNAPGCNSLEDLNTCGDGLCYGFITLSSQAEVDAFDCECLEGNLDISGNDIADLTPLSKLKKVRDEFVIVNNPMLKTLNGIGGIKFGSTIALVDNPNLTDISAFANLEKIDGVLYIQNNTQLSDVQAFHNLTSVREGLIIEDNPSLENLQGFSHLASPSNFLYLNNNDKLQNFDGLQGLTSASRIEIKDNDQLTSFKGLENLGGNPYRVTILNNPLITNVKAFSKVGYIDGDLTIENNNALITLEGLENLSSIRRTIQIKNNPQLSLCCPIWKFLNYYGASRIIENNAPGCNSTQEVLEDCTEPSVRIIRPYRHQVYKKGEIIRIKAHVEYVRDNTVEFLIAFPKATFSIRKSSNGDGTYDFEFDSGTVNKTPKDLGCIVRVVDANGNILAEDRVDIRVDPPASDPTVNITNLSEGQVFSKGDIIKVNADVANLGDNRVEFLIAYPRATFSIRKVQNGDGTYNFEFDSGTVNKTPKALGCIVRIIDPNGQILAEDRVDIMVNPKSSVNILKPVDNQIYTKGEIIKIEADIQGLGNNTVEYYIGFPNASFLIRRAQSGDGVYQFEFDSGTINKTPKALRVIVRIVDAQGNILAEDIVPILVNPANSLATNTLSPGLVMAFYPNKVKEGIQIRLKLVKPTQNVQFVIRDAMGQLVQSGNFNLDQPEDELAIDLLKNIPAGLYILEIRDQAGFSQIRFIKE